MRCGGKMIEQFKEEYRFLSNFWFFEKPMLYDEMYFKTSEHFYMAMKTLDKSLRQQVADTQNGGSAKELGRKLELREDWEQIKFDVMLYALRYKFSKYNPTLRKQLLDTGAQYLQEGNWWNDKTWGVCLKTGEGENNLGKLLMQVRDEIRLEGNT